MTSLLAIEEEIVFIAAPPRYHCYEDGVFWASHGNWIIRSTGCRGPWEQFAKIDQLPLLCKFSWFNRLTRNGIHHLIPFTRDTIVVLIRKMFLVYRRAQRTCVARLPRGSRPLRQAVVKINDSIVFGDYWPNPRLAPVRVYRLNPLTGVFHQLVSLSGVRHVHFIHRDILHDDSLLIGTGDEDSQCHIYSLDLKSNQLSELGGGSQTWRAISLIQKNNYLFWGSDCPESQNHIFRYDRQTHRLQKGIPIAGPAYYSTVNRHGMMYIATTIEDRKRHKAVIYSSPDGSKWTECGEWLKDRFPSRLFGYGVIEFIEGQRNLKPVFLNLQGLSHKGSLS